MPKPDISILDRLVRQAKVGPGRSAQTIYEVFSGQVLAQVPKGNVEDAQKAITRARSAQRIWADQNPDKRAKVLRRLAVLVYENRDQILDVIQAETGKSRASALEEVLDVIMTARHLAATGPGWLKTRRVSAMIPLITGATVNYRPKGVVGLVSPWNYPLSLVLSDAIAALMAGNAVVCKPDSQTPFSAFYAAQLLAEAGLPADVFQVVPGPGPVIGSVLVEQCDYLMFTGSTAVGKELASTAGRRLIGYSAELGGKNPMIVGAGADLDKVSEIATRAMFSNAGQLCISIERVYVENSIYEEFLTVLARRVEAMKISGGYHYGPEMGSLISKKQLENVQSHVADAVEKGARVICGGKALPHLGPFFFAPTVLTQVPREAICFAEETFGPVVSVYPVRDLDEAVALANESKYGLNAAVFCATLRQGYQVGVRLNTGTVNVNEGYATAWSSLGGPMGGMGQSGVGRRHGREGLLKYTEPQTVAVQRVAHIGTPPGADMTRWQELLVKAVNLMRFLPGR